MTHESKNLPPGTLKRFEFKRPQYWMMVLCAVCIALTVITTWPLWQSRDQPPNLPVAGFGFLSGLPFGVFLLIGLGISLVIPRIGFWTVVGVLFLSVLGDESRTQPQMVALPILMAGCIWPRFQNLAVWFLIAMWFWAGLHKLLSPYWWTVSSWSLLDRMGFEHALDWYWPAAMAVAILEIVLALFACCLPRLAAPICLALHWGIAAMLLWIDWNHSVLYWNLATGLIGGWLLWNQIIVADSKAGRWLHWHRPWPRSFASRAIVLLFFVVPAGFYIGVTPPMISHTLYSDYLPRAVITTATGPQVVSTWESLHAPLPRDRRIFRKYFATVSESGDKFHILDPRPAVDDIYLFHDARGTIREVTREEFFDDSTGFGAGQAVDDPVSIFELERAGAEMRKRSEDEMIFAIQFDPKTFDAESLRHLSGLPNLEQIQLKGCQLRNVDLRHLEGLLRLSGVGLSETPVNDGALKYLEHIPHLRVIEYRGSGMSRAEVNRLLFSRPR